jgi:hypothetical protein
MGIDCKVHLPENVRVKDVANVIGALAGCPVKQKHYSGAVFVEVENVKVESTSVPQMAQIMVEPPGGCVDGEKCHFVYYFFEVEEGSGRLLNPRSTAWWIAIMRRVVDFFGGSIDYSDCDDVDVDYSVPAKPDSVNRPTNGAEWDDLQNRILAIKPITVEEWKAEAVHAS